MVATAKSLFFRAYDLAWDKTCKADVKYSIIIDLQSCIYQLSSIKYSIYRWLDRYFYIDGGLYYGIHPNGVDICDNDKYFWVQAEAFSTAKLLQKVLEEGQCESGECQSIKKIYKGIWEYCWNNMIDHEHGAWFRIRYFYIYVIMSLSN